ncbi:MAG: hypothetical protein ACLS3V_07385 [Streptococcus sp.]
MYLIVDEVQTGLGRTGVFMLMSTTILNQISLLWQKVLANGVPVGHALPSHLLESFLRKSRLYL